METTEVTLFMFLLNVKSLPTQTWTKIIQLIELSHKLLNLMIVPYGVYTKSEICIFAILLGLLA